MNDRPERPPVNLIRRSFRPPPLGHAWAWIIIAVSVVILTSITLWVVVSGKTAVGGLEDREVVHSIVVDWRDRWSQVPGPPTVYAQESETMVRSRDYTEAARKISMALTLDPGRADLWVKMVCLSSVKPRPRFALSTDQIRDIMQLLELSDPTALGMDVARSWADFMERDGAPNEAIEQCFGFGLLGVPSETTGETLDTLPMTP